MIRYVDLRNYYWGGPAEPGDTGPFAFLDTITDTFVVLSGEQMWFDRRSLREAWANTPKPPRSLEQFLAFLPDDVPEDEISRRRLGTNT